MAVDLGMKRLHLEQKACGVRSGALKRHAVSLVAKTVRTHDAQLLKRLLAVPCGAHR